MEEGPGRPGVGGRYTEGRTSLAGFPDRKAEDQDLVAGGGWGDMLWCPEKVV